MASKDVVCQFLTEHYGGHYFHDNSINSHYCTLSHDHNGKVCDYGYCLLFWLDCCELAHPKMCQWGTLKNCSDKNCKLTHLDTFPCINPDCDRSICCASHNKNNKHSSIVVCQNKRCCCVNFHPKKLYNDKYHKKMFGQYAQLIAQNYDLKKGEGLIDHFEKAYQQYP